MTDPYSEIALQLPNDVEIGGALITMVEPNPGHEHAYNRWYEDDHFYSGAMHGPWTFAGRRWVAPRALRDRRAAVENSAVQPPDAGCYISLYWITRGHEEDNERWSFLAMGEALMPHGRGFTERTHVYTAFHRYRFGLVRDTGPMKPHLALDADYKGVLVEVVDAPTADGLGALERWLQEELLPRHLATSAAGMVLAFTPVPFTQGRIEQPGTPAVAPPEGVGSRLCLLWFLEQDPGGLTDDKLRAHHGELAASDLGTLAFSGPFVPTAVGTDRYVDELR
ncbi:MAG: hypothetical protein KDB21_20610 [Acidimicrobiales bacterium]|nr:hypothetical protein [Acidimicrobiales bacterium]